MTLQVERDSSRQENQTLKAELLDLVKLNEGNTLRIDALSEEKFDLEQEQIEKDRQISEHDEKVQELESTLQQTQESAAKLRKALQTMKDSMMNNEHAISSDAGNISRP
jgi:chromosome segregation ATPase